MNPSIQLKELLEDLSISTPQGFKSSPVLGVTSDSREVKPGYLFVAVQGGAQDGHAFVNEVEKAGAICIVGEKPLEKAPGVPYIQVSDSRKALALLASKFFGHPSRNMLMVGVTGTSGKTTNTYLMESVLQTAGHHVGVIGTVNFRHGAKILPSTHTTPGAVELQRLLAQMKSEGCTAVVMEVSSHALKQHRTGGIAFDGMIFTNLSPEHLDFHPDMEDYFRSKSLLFTELADLSVRVGKKPVAAIHSQDAYGQRLLQDLKKRNLSGFAAHPFASVSDLKMNFSGMDGKIAGISIRTNLTAQFNALNISGVVTLAKEMGIPDQAISKGIEALHTVPGRLERVPNALGINVLVDYAHKPDALDKVLRALLEVKGQNRLITVFGCGGDRDRTKRPVMGKTAVQLSDAVFITSDNPRTEDPDFIIQEILKGVQGFSNFQVEPDRKKAITAAILAASPGDLVVIAGKGHEDYQIIADPKAPGGTRKVHFDDREEALRALMLRTA